VTWKHKDTWQQVGQSFMVEVSRHEGVSGFDRGPHRWCVYAYLSPMHPRFDAIITRRMSDDGVADLPLHCGCTFNEWTMSETGKVLCKQIGADYSHYGDDAYSYMATADAAASVFADAQQLFTVLATEAHITASERSRA
jgi:hypothetical protein